MKRYELLAMTAMALMFAMPARADGDPAQVIASPIVQEAYLGIARG